MNKLWLCTWVVVALLPAAARSQQAPSLSTDYWIQSQRVNLADKEIAARILAYPGEKIIVSVLGEGETNFPSKKTIFRQMPFYAGKGDVFKDFIEAAHRKGKKVYASVDCLNWGDHKEKERNLFNKYPGLAAMVNEKEMLLDPTSDDGIIVSPAHPQVRQALRELVREICDRYPEVDGLFLRCRMSERQFGGYNETECELFKKKTGVDPYTIALGSGELNEEALPDRKSVV